MTRGASAPTIRRVKRRVAAWCSALLVIVQLTTGPIAHALSESLGCIGCTHATAGHSPTVDDGCADCPETSDGGPTGSGHHHGKGSCHCHCSQTGTHTPAMTPTNVVTVLPAGPESPGGEPTGPAFAAPLFDLLRPPN
jgi:hypothetical protein